VTRPRPEERVARLVEWVAAVAGPLTAVTAVLYFFGWTRTSALFGYFGVDPAILQFQLTDYLARSAGPAFGPAVGIVVGAALLLVVLRLAVAGEVVGLRHPVYRGGRAYAVRVPSIILIVVGAVATWSGASVALGVPDLLGLGRAVGLDEPVPAAVALAVGAVLLSAGLRLVRARPTRADEPLPPLPPVARGLVASVVLVALFWSVAVYSQQLGEALARSIDADPARQPAVIVHSAEPLGLWSADPVDPAGAPAGADPPRYRFTYTGLHLLIYANQRWLLLTGERGPAGRHVVAVLRDDDTTRVELTR
jgi:hypothetical protein